MTTIDTKGTKETTVLKLNHREIKRLLDAVQNTEKPLSLSAWEDSDRIAHCRLIHRLQRADRRFSLYES
jgi:hypothetical protein